MSEQSLPSASYKESSVDWIGTVPEHWQLLPARVAVSDLVEKNEGARNQAYLSLVAGKGVMPYADKGDMGNKKPDDLSKCKIVRKGNIIINSMNFFIGSYGMSEYEGVCSPVYIVLDVNQSAMVRRFALHVFGNVGFQLYLATFGNGILKHRAAIGWDDIKGAYLPIPPLAEQTQIAKFLDYETAKIDALIEKQQQLIALLKEKRQAVISHAVTKGLNPDAPMRDSGIEWLGEVPAHWEVTRVKHVADGFMYGTSEDCNTEDSGVPVLRIPNIKDRVLDYTDLKYARFSPTTEARYLLKENDILVVRTNGNPDLVGKSAIFKGDQKCMFASYLIKIRPSPKVLPEFLIELLNALCTREMLTLTARTSAGNYNMNCEGLGGTSLPLPPMNEQKQIADHAQRKVAQFNSLEARSEQAVELLAERRAALITAAVTGKIDVRGWKAPESAAEAEVA